MPLQMRTIATRGHQMFPLLDAAELQRMRHFGVTHAYN